MEPSTVIYIGINQQAVASARLKSTFTVLFVTSATEAVNRNLLSEAGAVVIDAAIALPVHEVQKIVAADKLIAILLLAESEKFTQTKQALNQALFVGKNATVVALTPELDFKKLLENAIMRTHQKRSFNSIRFSEEAIGAPRVKLAQMGSFLEYAPIAALLLNESDVIVKYNQQSKKWFSRLDGANVPLHQLVGKTLAEKLSAFTHTAHQPEAVEEIEFDGKILEVTSTVVYNEEGQKYFLLLLNDVTHLRQETAHIQSVLEALPQMAWTADADGMIGYFTQNWYFYTGQSKEEALGNGWTSVIAPDDQQLFLQQWQLSLHSGKPFQQAVRYKSRQGQFRWHLVRATPISSASRQMVLWVGTSTDIHDQVLLTEELERKVAERTRSLEISNSELQQFAHVSSHDLQEPLRKIRTFAGLLKEKDYENLNVASQRYLDKISFTAERMSNSLKALLNYTMLHKKERKEAVDLNHIVAQVLVDLELMIAQKNADVQVQPLPSVQAIPIQMQQVFYNLINNALKFSKKDVRPKVMISAAPVSHQQLAAFPQLDQFKSYYEIIVQDNGIGFDQSHAKKIFEVFQRLHTQAEIAGTGIGLSFVKKAIANHKGEVYATAADGVGTTFHVILPEF